MIKSQENIKLCQVQGVVHNRVLIGRTFILPGTIFVDEGSSTSQNVPMSWDILVKMNKKSEHWFTDQKIDFI